MVKSVRGSTVLNVTTVPEIVRILDSVTLCVFVGLGLRP